MRIGVLGGTFDPIHVAHVFMGATARHQFDLDTVLYPVANRPWQKAGRKITPAEDRFDMVAAALDGIDGLEPSRMEIDRGGTTYTADTVAQLRREHPDAELFLIVGTDVAKDLHTWERVDEVRQAVTLVIARRPGHPAAPAAAADPATPTTPPGWRTVFIEAPLLDLSSTTLRDWARQGRPLDGLVPPATVRLLRERGLYALPR